MINKVILLGRLGKEPEIKDVNGTKVSNFSIATDSSYLKDGKWVTNTEWHNIVAWGRIAENTAKYSKGDLLSLEGELTNRTWEQDGQKRRSTEVKASYIRKIPMGSSSASSSAKSDPGSDNDEMNLDDDTNLFKD